MRACVVVFPSLLLLASCAEESRQPLRQPPPPSHPIIQGNINTVSRADIRTALAIVRKDIIQRDGFALPIYAVNIADHDHVQVCYWPNGIDTCAMLERIKGKWMLQPYERVVVPGANVPTS
jgi:hypothetical protein